MVFDGKCCLKLIIFMLMNLLQDAKAQMSGDVPKEDVEWALSMLEPSWDGEEVELSEEDATRLKAAEKKYARYMGHWRRTIDGEIHRLIKIRRKALNSLPDDLRELVGSNF